MSYITILGSKMTLRELCSNPGYEIKRLLSRDKILLEFYDLVQHEEPGIIDLLVY